MRWIILLIPIAWFLLTDPTKRLANWFWPNSPAPWETVDAFYYPDRGDLLSYENARGFATLDECRDWVLSQARLNGDPRILNGDYECGFGQVGTFGDLIVYRQTAQ